MRAVFAIAPLALMLAWLNPHTGARSTGLAGSPLPSSPAWAIGDAPASSPDAAATAPLLAYRFESGRSRDEASQGAAAQGTSAPVNVLMNAAMVR